MTNVEIVRSYLDKFFSGKVRHTEVQSLLVDEFKYKDPMMSAERADEYIEQLKQFGDEMELHAESRTVIGEGDTVAALIDFQGPKGLITYSMWFTIQDGKFARIETIYDPRSFLE